MLLDTARFSLVNSGNRTLDAPKRSWKVDLDPGDDQIAGMTCLNLKSMYNDPSQMREALAWRLFRQAAVPAPRHTYARFGINGAYRGLFSVIEQVDRAFLKEHFGRNSRGNLIKVYCGELGPGTLEHRVGANGDDGGGQYRTDGPDPTYRLRSYSRAGGADTYDDLAEFVRVVNGIALPGGEDRFGTDAFAASVREIFNVDAFLRPTTTSTTPAAPAARTTSSPRRTSPSSRGTTTTPSASTTTTPAATEPAGRTRTCSTGRATRWRTGAATAAATGRPHASRSCRTSCVIGSSAVTTSTTSSTCSTPSWLPRPSTPSSG
jgi:hypothetical protein